MQPPPESRNYYRMKLRLITRLVLGTVPQTAELGFEPSPRAQPDPTAAGNPALAPELQRLCPV